VNQRMHDNWQFDVLVDIAAALRRDDLPRTAELVEDALSVMLQEAEQRVAGIDTPHGTSAEERSRIRLVTRQ